MFIKVEESFYNDTENKIVGDPVVTFEVKGDQEIDMQISQNIRQDPTSHKLDMRQACHCSLQLVCSGKMKHIIQIKIHSPPAAVKINLKNKGIQDWFQKPLHKDNCSASDNKSMEPKLENGNSSPPNSHSASKVPINEELEKDMQRFKNEIDMLQVELLALEKEKIQLPKEVQFSSVAQLYPTLCDPMNYPTPGLPVHHQLLEFT